MSEKLAAQTREQESKTFIKAQRRKGLTPVNLYGSEIEKSYTFFIDEKELSRAIKSGKKIHQITSDKGDYDVIFREIQRHPVTWELTHVDMLALKPGVKVTVKIPVHYEGIPFGVKNMGGVLIINSRSILVEALPKHIPNEIVIDVSPLKLKETIHASDVERENITIVSPSDTLLARCGITRAAVSAGEGEEGESEESAEGGEAAEGTEEASEGGEAAEEKSE